MSIPFTEVTTTVCHPPFFEKQNTFLVLVYNHGPNYFNHSGSLS